jgi:branched-chain amino acid transport system substrate-binding protein
MQQGSRGQRPIRTRSTGRMRTCVSSVALTAGLALAACGSSSTSSAGGGGGGSVTIAMNTSLSGPFGFIGLANQNGAKLAVAEINQQGGLLGKQINLEVKDDTTSASVATDLTKQEILSDKIVALLGNVSSSAALAEQTIVAKYKIPLILHTSNTDALTIQKFNNYTFSVVPNTGMEGRANAIAASKMPYQKWYLLGPDYEFGHSQLTDFKAKLQSLNPNVQIVGEDYPKLGATDYSSFISKIQAAKPDVVYSAEFGGDLITLITQAKSAGLVGGSSSPAFMGLFDVETLRNFGGGAPVGAYAYSRSPYFAIKTPAMQKFVSDYKAQYNVAPSDWAINAYDAVNLWAAGVKKAGSFDGDPVSSAMSGMAFDSVRGTLNIRAIDHECDCAEYEGKLAADSDAGFPTFAATAVAIPGSQTILPEADVTSLRTGG